MSTKEIMDTIHLGRRPRKSWPEALKREIVAAASRPGASVSMIARDYDVNANQVFSWRKQFMREQASPLPPRLVPVEVVVDGDKAQPDTRSASCGCFDGIDLFHPTGWRVRIGRDANGALLRLVLDELTRR